MAASGAHKGAAVRLLISADRHRRGGAGFQHRYLSPRDVIGVHHTPAMRPAGTWYFFLCLCPASVPLAFTVRAPTVPLPPNVPPFTVTVELAESDPFTSKVPAVTMVAPV